MDLLPDELLREIFSYLSNHFLHRARMISRRFVSLIDMTHFSIGLILDSEMAELISVFGRYNKPIGLTFRKLYAVYYNITLLSRLTQLTSLDIRDKYSSLQLHPLTNLRALTAIIALSQLQKLTQLTDFNTNAITTEEHTYPMTPMQILTTKYSTLMSDAVLYCPHVTKLTHKMHFPSDEYVLHSMTRLKSLQLSRTNVVNFMPGIAYGLTGLESLSTEISVTDLRAEPLTSLTVLAEHMYGDVNWNIAYLTNLRQLAIYSNRFMRGESLAPFKRLESFTMRGSSLDPPLTQLICSNLTQMNITLSRNESVACAATFTNLVKLKLSTDRGVILDLATLSILTKLTSLSVCANKGIENFHIWTILRSLVKLKIYGINNQLRASELTMTSLTRLSSLKVSGNHLPDIDLTNVTRLLLLKYNQPLEHKARKIIGLATLTNLTLLHSTSSLNFTQLAGLTWLQSLKLNAMQFDCGFSVLTNLQRLTSLTGDSIMSGKQLTLLTRLQVLRFIASEGSDNIRKNLQKKLSYCYNLTYQYFDNDEDYIDDE